MNLLGINKRWWLIIGIGGVIIFLLYQAFIDRRQTVPTNSQVIISLQRTTCFGTCPSYEITIYENGTVVYEGRDFVGAIGTRKTNIGEEKVQQLVAKIESIGYFSLQDNYVEVMATCNSSAITYVKIGEKEKRISHYNGDFNAPGELFSVEEAIDEMVNSRQWIEACGFWYPYFCEHHLSFWVLAAIPLAVALWIVRVYVTKQKPFVGIIRGQGVVALVLGIILLVVNSNELVYRSFDLIVFYFIYGVIEIVAVLLIGLFLVWLYRWKNSREEETDVLPTD